MVLPTEDETEPLTPETPDYGDKDSIRERFLVYHQKNPQVLEEILKLCYEARENGQDDWSINGIFERLRWHYEVDVEGDYEFKFSNDYRAIYARMIMYIDEDLDGFFQVNHRDAYSDEPDGWIKKQARQAHDRLIQNGYDCSFNESPDALPDEETNEFKDEFYPFSVGEAA